MTKHKHLKKIERPAAGTEESRSSSSDVRSPTFDLPMRPWLLAALTMLFVARPLIPSEGVAWLGDGQPVCLLWLFLGLGTWLAAIKVGGFPRRFGGVELLVGVFVLLHSIAAWRGTSLGSPRPAMNMLWEGVAMAMSFLLVRQLVLSAREARAVVSVMIALAVVLSSFGFYQVFVGMPADRAEYARDADNMLRRAGQWYPKNSPERAAFENRLNSTEPLATFALTNSLAGYLVPWLIVGLGIAVANRLGRQEDKRLAISLAILALVLGGCLLLTKSRSAYAACAVGLLALVALMLRGQIERWWKLVLGGVAVLAVLVTVAFTVGGLDEKVVSEAGKSLGYRLQYWQSTTAMIRDRPLLGVGPGNFQDFYTQYKLPEASEEIRDPHNWMFEIAATAGLPALAVFCGVLAIFFWRAFRAKPQAIENEHRQPVNDWYVYGGAALALPIGLVMGALAGLPLGFERLAGGLLIGGATVFALSAWVREGTLPPSFFAIGVAVMLINLFAAGGIMYPAVAGSLWLLLGLGLNLSEPRQVLSNRWIPPLAFVSCAALAVSQYLTGYSPVLRCQGALMEAQNATNDAAVQQQRLTVATEADPRAADPWQELAALKLRQWLNYPGPRVLREFRDASAQFLALKPQSSSAYRLVGNWWHEVFAKSGSKADAQNAVSHLTRAVELYPHHAMLRAELATSLAEAGASSRAEQEAATAIRLDATTPHADKRLSAEIRRKMRELADDSGTGSR